MAIMSSLVKDVVEHALLVGALDLVQAPGHTEVKLPK